jgi:hypothetical protein
MQTASPFEFAQQSHFIGCFAVYLERFLGMGFTIIHVGEGGAIHETVKVEPTQNLLEMLRASER